MQFEDIKNVDELLKYMSDNIVYGFVDKFGNKYTDQYSKEFDDKWLKECVVQTGKEILNTKIGTCWDQVELERLWFKKNNYSLKTIFMGFEAEDGNDFPTHTFLVYQDNNKWFLFGDSNWQIHEFNTLEESIKYVKQELLDNAISMGVAKKEDYDLIRSFEYQELLNSCSVKEYLNYVTTEVV